jgi:hypothetical protein
MGSIQNLKLKIDVEKTKWIHKNAGKSESGIFCDFKRRINVNEILGQNGQDLQEI